jgi:hypothetical protein
LILRVIARGAISLRESLGVFAPWRETAFEKHSFPANYLAAHAGHPSSE